ncbi:MAG: DUF896 domain-containing protein [Clostridia bacterium]|nr:DUF896 domain-containing protein [Clostridia bacterium]
MSALLDRINQLAAKARAEGLTEEESRERDALRQQYLAAVRRNLNAQLDRVVVAEADGTLHPLRKKEK